MRAEIYLLLALLLAVLLVPLPAQVDCRVSMKIAVKYRARAYSDCMIAVGIPCYCDRIADGAFEEKAAQLHMFGTCEEMREK